MKKLLYLLLLLPSLAWGQEYARMSPYILGGGVAAATCSAPTGNKLSERFGDGGSTACYSGATGGDATCDATWVKVIYTPDWQHALTGTPPEGTACAYGVNLPTSTTPNRERIYWDNGSGIDDATYDVDIKFSLYLNAEVGDTSGGAKIVSWAEDTEGANIAFYLRLDGSLDLIAIATSNSVKVRLSTETWYEITIHLDAGTATDSYLQVVGGGSTTCDVAAECKFQRTTKDGRYLIFGKNHAADYGWDMDIGYASVNAAE